MGLCGPPSPGAISGLSAVAGLRTSISISARAGLRTPLARSTLTRLRASLGLAARARFRATIETAPGAVARAPTAIRLLAPARFGSIRVLAGFRTAMRPGVAVSHFGTSTPMTGRTRFRGSRRPVTSVRSRFLSRSARHVLVDHSLSSRGDATNSREPWPSAESSSSSASSSDASSSESSDSLLAFDSALSDSSDSAV
jgi:hypothetical protein